MVTGAGSGAGIGFATARLLGHAGVSVAVTSTTARIRERAKELRQTGMTATGHVADLTEPAALRTVVEEILRQHGHIDILVNNAGMSVLGIPEISG